MKKSDTDREVIRRDNASVFSSDQIACDFVSTHVESGFQMSPASIQLRSRPQSRQHGPLWTIASWIGTKFSELPPLHLGSTDIDYCAPFWVFFSGHDEWHEDCGIQCGRWSAVSGMMGQSVRVLLVL